MLTRYIVAYDISDPRRLRKVYEIMKGAGVHLQYSVFQCDLSDRQLEELRLDLAEVIAPREDQVLFVALGDPEKRGATCISSLGRIYDHHDRACVII